MARASRFLTAAVIMAVGCGPLDNNSSRRDKERATLLAERGVHIVAMAAGSNGHRLVLIDENGDRLGDLTRLPAGGEIVRDNSPAWSPDGRWIVFVSSRERASMEETSLWIIAARTGAEPRRLTQGTAVDLAPTWTPDGKALVFSSNRGGGIHLWRLDLAPGPDGWPQAAGQPVQLTRGDHHDLYASVEPGSSGARIVYMRVNQDRSRSSLWLWSSGTETELTSGPADMTPAWSHDGRTIAFAAPSLAGDLDLHAIDPDGSNRRVIIIEPDGDQTGPVWSGDSRYLFATSTWRSRKTGKRLLFSITFVDMVESPLIVRALHDSSLVPSSRTSPALSRADLDAAALHRNLPYRDALKRAGERELNRRQNDATD